MKKLLILTAVIFAVLISSANAQLIGAQCSVDDIDVVNTVTDTVHVKVLYTFHCGDSTSYQGQVTKMLIKVPYTDVQNLKASDSYGSMEVLEGPAYVGASKDTGETTIGVMFRKGLLISSEADTYTVAIEFDSTSMAQKVDSMYSMKPGGLVDNVKVTMVSTGITETTIPILRIDYELNLPSDSSISQVSPAVCQFQASKVTCSNLNTAQFDEIEVKWTQKTQIQGWKEKLEGYTKDFIPKITNAFKGLTGKISDLLKREK